MITVTTRELIITIERDYTIFFSSIRVTNSILFQNIFEFIPDISIFVNLFCTDRNKKYAMIKEVAAILGIPTIIIKSLFINRKWSAASDLYSFYIITSVKCQITYVNS